MNGTPLKLLALGDSYTIGERVAPEECFPVQTAGLLKKENLIFETVKITAATGWTTDELKAAILSEHITGPYDVVTLLIGVNNQYRGRDIINYRLEFRELLQMASGFTGKGASAVYVLSIPDWGVTPFAGDRDPVKIAREIDAFNAINREEAQLAKAHYIDITDITRRSPEQPELLADDGLHPSGIMYRAWAERLADVIRKTI